MMILEPNASKNEIVYFVGDITTLAVDAIGASSAAVALTERFIGRRAENSSRNAVRSAAARRVQQRLQRDIVCLRTM